MGNTLPTALEILMNYEQSFGRFRRALRRGDQRVLDDLFHPSFEFIPESAFSFNPVPMEWFLPAMILEEYKNVICLRSQITMLLPKEEDSNQL